MRLAAFFHVWADGNWQRPLAEFLDALERSRFEAPLYLGIVGRPEHRHEVLGAIKRSAEVKAFALHGFEQVTLKAVRRYAQRNDGAVLYAHTKGAYRDYQIQAPWRREMIDRVVKGWERNLKELNESDVVGCSWQWDWDTPGFLSNFWMARCDYLRALSDPSKQKRRTSAETWLGERDPRVFDLSPSRMRWIPTDGREIDGGRSIHAKGQSAILISEDGENVLAVQLVPQEWLEEAGITERCVWRVLSPAEAQAWRDSYK